MSLLGKGVLAIWNGIDHEQEDEFLKWHVHEHIPDRIALPGFLRARRYVAFDGFPRYFNFYETASIADLSSASYRQSLNSPSAWTEQVVRHFRNTSRTICQVASTRGMGEGAVVEALRLETDLPSAEFKSRLARMLETVPLEHGVVGIHLLEGLADRNHPQETAELQLRGGQPDKTVDWVVLVEAVEASAIEKIQKGPLNDADLAHAGVRPTITRGLYALQFSLTKTEFEAGRTSH